MDTARLNDWMQVVGIFAVVASLIFVGLEMRQAQKISMSQAYQSRTTAAVEWNSAFAANPVALSAFRKAAAEAATEMTPEEYDALRRTLGALYYLYDNAHYQYESGFVSNAFWNQTRGSLRSNMAIPTVKSIFMEMAERGGRPEFRELIHEIGEELATQAHD